ncbi:MAG: hypothetical protein NTY79_05800 [Chloroflexi bacterium]|nr:hypothetical protein [Chloroflexota bacterium]
MRNAVLLVLILLLATAGCITVDMGGGSSSKVPTVVKFAVSPNTIGSGEAAILSWEVENASSVSIDPGIPAAPSTGADKVVPATTTTYILTASNKYGSTRSTVLLTVGATGGITPAPASVTPVINSFSAAPSSITSGGTAVLTWSTTNATTTYLLEATNGSNSTSFSTMVVVSSPATPPPSSLPLPTILSFTASPASVALGGSTTLNWNTLNATSASIAGYGTVPVSGSLTVNTTGTGGITFYLTATNSAGSSNASTTVSVGSASPPPMTGSPPIAALYLSPSSITSGGTATLSWMTSGASSLAINNGVKNLVGVTGASGSLSVSPSFTTTYTLTASNAYGNTYDSKVLTVTAAPIMPVYRWPTINDFHCSHTTVVSGNQAKLYWTVTDADTITIDNGIGSVGASGTVYIYPVTTTTYTLMASNGGNTVAQSVTVNVTP